MLAHNLRVRVDGHPLRATHAVAAVVAAVTISVANRDRTAVVAARGVGLEAGELIAPASTDRAVGLDLERHAGPLQEAHVHLGDGQRARAVAVGSRGGRL